MCKIAVDLLEFGNILSQCQTYIISTGLLLTAINVRQEFGDEIVGNGEYIITMIIPCILILAGIINKIMFLSGKKEQPQAST